MPYLDLSEDPEPVGNGGRRGMVDHLPRCWPFIWASRKLGTRFRSPRDTDYSMLRTIIGPCLGKPSFAGAEFEVLRWWRLCCRLEGDKFGVAAPSVFPAKVYVFLAAQAAPANRGDNQMPIASPSRLPCMPKTLNPNVFIGRFW